jgi:hypothetical protein
MSARALGARSAWTPASASRISAVAPGAGSAWAPGASAGRGSGNHSRGAGHELQGQRSRAAAAEQRRNAAEQQQQGSSSRSSAPEGWEHQQYKQNRLGVPAGKTQQLGGRAPRPGRTRSARWETQCAGQRLHQVREPGSPSPWIGSSSRPTSSCLWRACKVVAAWRRSRRWTTELVGG